ATCTLASISVAEGTVTDVTVTPGPSVRVDVAFHAVFTPRTTTLIVVPGCNVGGVTSRIAGVVIGAVTRTTLLPVAVSVMLARTVVTVTSRKPRAAAASTVIETVSVVAEWTVTELTLMPVPANARLVDPCTQVGVASGEVDVERGSFRNQVG